MTFGKLWYIYIVLIYVLTLSHPGSFTLDLLKKKYI